MYKQLLKTTAASAVLFFIGCVQTMHVRDVIDLPPPQNVRASRQQDYITVTWQPPAAGELKGSGYLLYHAPRSLSTIALAHLPPPLEIAAQLSQFTFASADSAPIFIHMRTRAGRKYVSLPSLPEVIVPAMVDNLRGNE